MLYLLEHLKPFDLTFYIYVNLKEVNYVFTWGFAERGSPAVHSSSISMLRSFGSYMN